MPRCHRDMTMAWLAEAAKKKRGVAAGVGDIPTLHTAGDIDAMKASLKARVAIVDPVARGCAKMSQTDETGWGVFYTRVVDFTNSPTPLTINVPGIQAQFYAAADYNAALDIWIQRLNAAGCNVPIVVPPPRESVTDTLLRYGAIAGGVALALALGYGVFQVVKVVKET